MGRKEFHFDIVFQVEGMELACCKKHVIVL